MTAALQLLTQEVQRLSQRLEAAADEVHRPFGLSSVEREILSAVEQQPQTVPQIARARSVSRQSVQVVVEVLRREGLLEALPNPATKRSPLIGLTRAGEKAVREAARREAKAFGSLPVRGLSEADLRHASDVLREVREFFDSAGRQKRARPVTR
jgi:DNA-binding MarR family transcriptional regulator